jgi:arylsulfate sulfotransferase
MRAIYLAFCLLLVATLAGCGGGGSSSDSGSGSVETLGLNATNITLDPFSTAPLSARLEFSAPEPGTVKVTVLGKPSSTCNVPGGIEISHQFAEVSSDFVLPVLGLYPDYANTLIVDFKGASGATMQDQLTILTAPISPVTAGPVTLPISVEIISNNLPADDSGLYLFSQQKSAFDQCGEVRWMYRGEGWQFYEMLPNGNWLGSINNDQISYHFGDFSEFTMLGETVNPYLVENYLHHEIQKLPWGNYLVATNSSLINLAEDGMPEEDVLVEIRATDGVPVKSWDFNTILDPARAPIPSNERPDDWLHLNSAVYDASDKSIIITAQRQSLMAKIDYATGDLIWILGAHEGWGPAFQDKLLTPVDALGHELDIGDQYFWPYGPHAALTFGDGAVALFDNGAWRGLYEDRAPLAGNGEQDFSRGIEYLVDEVNMTVQIVWQFDWDKRVFTSITGDIDYLVNGNYLLGFVGTSPGPDNPRVMEVDPATNEILFNAVSNRGELEYRVEKINLYTGY